MFKSILGRKKEDIGKEDAAHAALSEKISKMNLTQMRSYVKGGLDDFPVTEDGLMELLTKLTTEDSKTKQYYLKADDMDSKKKKAFDLVLLIAKNKKINLVVIELIQKFCKVYKEIVDAYDREYKEIYASRFEDAINLGLTTINSKIALKNKMNVLSSK